MAQLGDNLTPQDGLPPAPKRQGKSMGPLAKAKTRKIMVEDHPDIPPTGLFVGHNGYGYLIKSGVVIDAPLHVIEILDHAIISVPVVNPNTLQVIGHRERMRFNYRNMELAA